jgi:cytochrome o ubiquinol oxidase subunit 3
MFNDTKVFGFWIYLMTDLVIFAVLFSAYAVLHTQTFGGPGAKQLYHMPSAFAQTLILLTSSYTCSLATFAAHREKKKGVIAWFAVTFLLGIAFLCLEIREFSSLAISGNSWERSAFLSSFFTLVGTHGFHITCGLVWMLITMIVLMFRKLTEENLSRLLRLALFWHFLDIVWIFIFTVVYAMGHLYG